AALHAGKPSHGRSTQPAVRSDSSPLPVTACPSRQWMNCGRRRTPSSLCLWRRSAGQFTRLPARRRGIARKDSSRWRLRMPSRGLRNPEWAPPASKSSYHSGGESWPSEPYYTGPEGRNYFIPNLWPLKPEGFASAAAAYYAEMEKLAALLMRLTALGLDVDEY